MDSSKFMQDQGLNITKTFVTGKGSTVVYYIHDIHVLEIEMKNNSTITDPRREFFKHGRKGFFQRRTRF